MDLRDQKVHLHGDAAIVTADYEQKGTANGRDFSRTGTQLNSWIKRDGR